MSADVEHGNFTLAELIDLALCSPEIGAVNFNILRILLQEVLATLGIIQQTATLNDVEAHQINNFKSYIQGAGTPSPMPGVLRYAPGMHPVDGQTTPRTARSDSESKSVPTSSRSAPTSATGRGKPQPIGVYARQSVLSHHTPADHAHAMSPAEAFSESIDRKVARLERHLEALYALPTNSTLLGTGLHEDDENDRHLSVNDMWQIIQLNNRVAATEAAIQKMASLIEELALQIKSVKKSIKRSSGMQEEVAEIGRTSSAMAMQLDPCMEKCERTWETAEQLKVDLEKIKKYLLEEIAKLSRAAGIAVTARPSFMEPRKSALLTAASGKRQGDGTRDSSFSSEGPGQRQQGSGTGSGQRGSGTGSGQRGSGTGSGQHDSGTSSGQAGSGTNSGQRHSGTNSGQRLSGTGSGQPGSGTDSGQRGSGQRGSGTGSLDREFAKIPSFGRHSSDKSDVDIPVITPQMRGTLHFGFDGEPLLGEQQFNLLTFPPKIDAEGQSVSSVKWFDKEGQAISIDYDDNGLPIVFGPDGRQVTEVDDLRYDESGQAMFYGKDGERIFGSHVQSFGTNGRLSHAQYYGEFPGEEGDRDTGPRGFMSNEFNKEQRASFDMMTGDDGPHDRHSQDGNLSEAHPEIRHQGISHVPVDVSTGLPLEELQENLDPFRDFQYPTILEDGTVVPGKVDPRYEEQCRDQADDVQKELQKQYKQLVEMQRQMALEIQDKMEMVYQKLLKEIAAQHSTTSPYMAVGLNADKCLGPGVCSGFGLPAGTAVVQFPQKPDKVEVCSKEGKVCPGKDVCPGKEVCPTCKDDILHQLRVPGGRPKVPVQEYGRPAGLSSSNENLLRQMTSMTLLPRDLEELREKLKDRGTIPNVFDEADVLEKLQTVWEAVGIMKNNEENMAVRIIQQDRIIKKIPEHAMEELGLLSASGVSLDKRKTKARLTIMDLKGMRDLGGEDLQLIFNNLSSLVLENAAMKEKLQKIGDAMLDFEQTIVTKSMLLNALSDKADKGLMNTKVSYDEFGAGMDELQSRHGNLMEEVYRKNELWKDVTDQIQNELLEKLNKAEIGPLRSYFKNHLSKLEDQVKILTQIMDEPDPAGTRKKLLRDYNCISCDRHTNISGMTNASRLPLLGPILAGHTTASQRAFELYRMRPENNRYDPEGRDLCQMERQARGDANNNNGGSSGPFGSDLMHLVNRYVGGSHTVISPRARISALHKRPSAVAPGKQSLTPRPMPTAAPQRYYYDE